MTQRWKVTLEYDGTNFAGWQRQENSPSIQQTIEDAIKSFSKQEVHVQGSGRTDAGVHAAGQVAHFDLEGNYTYKNIRHGINHHLGDAPIVITTATPVDDDFHARFCAKQRYYCYRIICGRHSPSPLDNERAWRTHYELDIDAMREAAAHLIGTHDFTTFRATQCQAQSPIKTLDDITITEMDHYVTHGRHIHINIQALSFLHHQCRNIVGTLFLVGRGKWTPDDFKAALEAKDRTKGGLTAPAEGLYFMRTDYEA